MSVSLLKNLERAVNDILILDEEINKKLTRFDGKTIAIEIVRFNIKIYIRFTGQVIGIDLDCNHAVDVYIKASALTFLFMLLRGSEEQSVSVGDMEVSGDVRLAQEFQSYLKSLDIDWEEYISQCIGDYPAHKIGNLFRSSQKYITDSKSMFEMDISEYLRYEKELLPDQIEIDEFNSAVDIIRNDVERLQQRLKRLDNILPAET